LRQLGQYLGGWESWAAELMESHLSYPLLGYFRSLHNNQSWLAALTTVLDACALIVAYTVGECQWQARLTFAISRHALVDLAQTFRVPPSPAAADRLPPQHLDHLLELLAAAGIRLIRSEQADKKFAYLRGMYEPFAYGLGQRLAMPLPAWFAATEPVDNWRTSAWGRSSPELITSGRPVPPDEEHL
jgi:hypothetical protein